MKRGRKARRENIAKLLQKAAPLGKVKPGVRKKYRGRIGSEALFSA
jgi:hypothetical protein